MTNLKEKKNKILLVSMPWTTPIEPSLGLGILKAELLKEDFECKVCHLNLLLLKYLSFNTYMAIANIYALNDFIFTRVFEKEISKAQIEILEERIDFILESNSNLKREYKTKSNILSLIYKIRNEIIPKYLNDCIAYISKYEYEIIGFTCLFDQTIASLSLAKLIKSKFPDKLVLLGGYALEGDVGCQIIKSFDFVDCVCFGDGENTIVNIAKSFPNLADFHNIPNITYRHNGEVYKNNLQKNKVNLNDSSPPNYDDFILDIKYLEKYLDIHIEWLTIPIETSRGCWWGQVKHCIFCGIDDQTMKYRQKDEVTILSLLQNLRKKYGDKVFRVCDYILPNNYFKNLLPTLSRIEPKYRFTCEIKANINYEKMMLLQEAGFYEVQPGIESFSTNVLSEIDKGTSGIQNISCLILGKLLGVKIDFNILFGFPNDIINDYKEQIKTIPLLYHLDPPCSRTQIGITRFAPLQSNPTRFGINNDIVYEKKYDIIFSQNLLKELSFDLNNYCYFFELPYKIESELSKLYQILVFQIDYWISIHRIREVYLCYELKDKNIIFYDTRFGGEEINHFSHSHYQVYKHCIQGVISINKIKERLIEQVSSKDIDKIVADLDNHRLVYIEKNKIIGLALKRESFSKEIYREKKWSFPYL